MGHWVVKKQNWNLNSMNPEIPSWIFSCTMKTAEGQVSGRRGNENPSVPIAGIGQMGKWPNPMSGTKKDGNKAIRIQPLSPVFWFLPTSFL